MLVRGFKNIDSIDLPLEWDIDEERQSSLFRMKSAHPKVAPEVEISFFMKRNQLAPPAMASFRQALEKAPHVIEPGSAELKSLEGALGNAGNNQWNNRLTGIAGPSFRLVRTETFLCNGRCVLSASGTFIEGDSKKPVTEFYGIFCAGDFDNMQNFQTEELFLQVPAKSGYLVFERYLKVFKDCLRTIRFTENFKP